MAISNARIAELLALRGEELSGDRQRAYRRASRAAFKWPEEAAELAAGSRPLTELPSIGAKLAGLIHSWFEEPPGDVPEPPDTRAGFTTFSAALALCEAYPGWTGGVKSDLQMHTLDSDGKVTAEEMAATGIERGYAHIAITDHSKGLKIAGGMDEAQLAVQGARIDSLNARLASEGRSFRVLKALEMNLSPTGEGDMDADALQGLDLVLGSFHSRLRVTDDQTDRYLAALRNPEIHVLGHPRGRIYNFRVGLKADWKTVCEAAADAGKALEIDAFPNRQDLNVELLHLAREAETWISIGTDAHTPDEMQYLPVGLAAALEARIPKERILNFLTTDELLAWTGRGP